MICSPTSTCIPGTPPCSASDVCHRVACDDAAHTCSLVLIDDDSDGYGVASSPPLAPCNDCDDTDPNAHPFQLGFFTTPRHSGGYDYDCDGREEEEFAVQGLCIPSGPTTCSHTPGWLLATPPACGLTGDFIASCTSGSCAPFTVTYRQACH
jgi:hypothetical protein